MEYMEDFEITSDKEAALVITIAQSLSEALKAFCEKKATLKHIKSLPPLMKQGMRNTNQHKSIKASEYYQDHPGDSWNHGCLTKGLAQLQHAPNISSTPTNSYAYQMREKASSYGLNCKDLATMYTLESSLALQPGGFGTGIEWMKQFNQSVSANFQFATVKEKTPYLKTSQNSYLKHYQDGSQVPSNRIADNRLRNWGGFRTSHDLRASSFTPISYSPPRTYQASYALQKHPSWYHDGPDNSNLPASSSSFESSGLDWEQQADYPKPVLDDDVASYTPFPGGSLNQQQNTQIYNNAGCGSKTNLIADIMSQLQGNDAATLANMIQQLVPYYPDLQNIDIHAFAQTLSEMN
ncbi:uncharacterized protein LOC121934154 [Sceloporus undulatus]|uniref:uncharacterized protein LOC121934154 n=1 Tax=Sceloporus undulatus TaxID=8520 RepID=UPI001C4DB1A9|nr:uncharacterized protein LOC121934154 [Sceloporus undulatus]